MDYDGLRKLTEQLMKENPENMKSSEGFLLHVQESYNVAKETVEMACFNLPELKTKLDENEVSLAGGLHDIGRILKKNQLFNELRGARYIEENGIENGIADNLVDIYRIAQMIRPHFVVSEQFNDEKNEKEKIEFEPIDSRLLIPRTWQEAIVVYAELSNLGGERVSFIERLNEIKERYANNPKYKEDSSVLGGLQKGLTRIIETCGKVENLRKGKLKKADIARYGFL